MDQIGETSRSKSRQDWVGKREERTGPVNRPQWGASEVVGQGRAPEGGSREDGWPKTPIQYFLTLFIQQVSPEP